jgi:hypothetical protein
VAAIAAGQSQPGSDIGRVHTYLRCCHVAGVIYQSPLSQILSLSSSDRQSIRRRAVGDEMRVLLEEALDGVRVGHDEIDSRRRGTRWGGMRRQPLVGLLFFAVAQEEVQQHND